MFSGVRPGRGSDMSFQIAALALLDSINLLTITLAAYLLGTPRPTPRTLSYVGGTALGYFAAGAIMLLGWQAFLERVGPLLDPVLVGLLAAVVGVVMVLGALHAIRRPSRRFVFRPPTRIHPLATFALGAVIGLLYAPTDPRHNLAIGLIVAHTQSWSEQLAWLVWYNAFYILLLLGMVGVRVFWPERSGAWFGWLTTAIGNFMHRNLPVLVFAAGVVLIIDALRRVWM